MEPKLTTINPASPQCNPPTSMTGDVGNRCKIVDVHRFSCDVFIDWQNRAPMKVDGKYSCHGVKCPLPKIHPISNARRIGELF
ncbi:Uncharacterized protein APZ42_030911 [Daphnia magna]|uniref:Uncharacterized protein n=1 Tax=Daphnia magna TaxID=35525 RepID=A0A164NEU8_9CRUS|nr:Uncharacterized protein APZ42_030911 [Daphnia magna]